MGNMRSCKKASVAEIEGMKVGAKGDEIREIIGNGSIVCRAV